MKALNLYKARLIPRGWRFGETNNISKFKTMKEEILQAVKEWIIETFSEHDYGKEVATCYDSIEELLDDFDKEMACRIP